MAILRNEQVDIHFLEPILTKALINMEMAIYKEKVGYLRCFDCGKYDMSSKDILIRHVINCSKMSVHDAKSKIGKWYKPNLILMDENLRYIV
jgi:hypothetical protein